MRTLYRFLFIQLVLLTGYSFAHAHEGGDDSTHRHGRDSIRMHHHDSIIVHHHDIHHGDSTGFHFHDTIVHHHEDTIIHHHDSTGLHGHDSTELHHHHDSTGLHGHDSTGLHGHDSTGHHGWDYHHHRMVDFDSVMYHRFDGDDNIDTTGHHKEDSTRNHHHEIGDNDSTGHFNFDSTWVHQLDSLIHRIRQLLDSLHQHNFHFGDNDSTEDHNHDSTGNGDDTIHHNDTTKINAKQIGTLRGLITQNVFPNPVLSSQSNSTILQYTLDKSEHVTVGLFDANGVLVESALDADMSAGLHSLAIGTNNLRPGAYSLQIQAGNWIRFQRVMINP